MTILPCQKNYVSTWFKLLNYIYYFNCIKIFTWLNYIFYSIYSNTSPSTKHNLPNHLFKKKKKVCWGQHTHFHPPWPFQHVKKITSQHDSNYWTTYIILIVSKYLLDSTILFTQYILTPVHPLKKNWVCWGPHTHFLSSMDHFDMSKKLHLNTIQTIQLHI